MIDDVSLYKSLYLIRRFEETVLDKFQTGIFFGTTHVYLGQEANAVGVIRCLKANDIVFSNHRCHGHFLAYGGDIRTLFAELMGRATGVCGGRGGSQHLQWRNFYSNGVQGGIVPIATGMAFAEKIKHNDAVSVAFLGDGTMGAGVIYEAFNLASLWELPVLYVVENNRIAQTTPIDHAVAGSIGARFSAFDISVVELDTCDVLMILSAADDLITEVRNHKAPRALILQTNRFGPHSKSDDTRDPELIANLKRQFDPIEIHGSRLNQEHRKAIESEIEVSITLAFQQAINDPFPGKDIM